MEWPEIVYRIPANNRKHSDELFVLLLPNARAGGPLVCVQRVRHRKSDGSIQGVQQSVSLTLHQMRELRAGFDVVERLLAAAVPLKEGA